jgi:DNA (cytosine-5)-methyltransferase 1
MIRYRDGKVRYFTVHEAKLIQTFPRDFVILGAWGEALRQIGNAVPVRLSEQLGHALNQAIGFESNEIDRLRSRQSLPSRRAEATLAR